MTAIARVLLFAVALLIVAAFGRPAWPGPLEDAARHLEADLADHSAAIAAQIEAINALAIDIEDLRTDVAATRALLNALAARVESLEANGGGPAPEPEPTPEPDPGPCLVSQVELGQNPMPGSANLLPGRIEAEDFDLGGEGVAYHDVTPGNAWHFYRDDVDVDIKPTGDPEGGQFQLGLNKDGEWVEYTVCAKSETYDVRLRVLCGIAETSGGCGTITVSLGGQALGSVKVPFTGSWDTAAVTLVIPNVVVVGGNKILRLSFSGNYLDVNWIQFVTAGTANRAPTDLWLCPALPDGTADVSDPAKCNQGMEPG